MEMCFSIPDPSCQRKLASPEAAKAFSIGDGHASFASFAVVSVERPYGMPAFADMTVNSAGRTHG